MAACDLVIQAFFLKVRVDYIRLKTTKHVQFGVDSTPRVQNDISRERNALHTEVV